MYLLIENGEIISKEICFGNAAELQMVLEQEEQREITIIEESVYWAQMEEMAEMA